MQYYTTGAKKDKKDRRDLRACGVISAPIEYPEIFDLEDDFDSKMQWSRGSCTNQAYSHHKQRQENIKLSARFGMAMVKTFIENNTNYGAYTRNAFKAGKEYGLPKEKLCPEPPADMSWEEYVDATLLTDEAYVDALKHKIKSYWRVEKNLNKIKDTLLTGHSIVVSMGWYSVFNRPMTDGTLPSFNQMTYVGGHAVELVGWNDNTQLLKFKNSWGEGWGNNGDFYMPYDYIDYLIWDLWTSLDIDYELPVDNLYGHLYQPIDKWRDVFYAARVLLKYKRFPTRREANALLNYWDMETVFEGKNNDIWLHYTHIEANKKGLI